MFKSSRVACLKVLEQFSSKEFSGTMVKRTERKKFLSEDGNLSKGQNLKRLRMPLNEKQKKSITETCWFQKVYVPKKKQMQKNLVTEKVCQNRNGIKKRVVFRTKFLWEAVLQKRRFLPSSLFIYSCNSDSWVELFWLLIYFFDNMLVASKWSYSPFSAVVNWLLLAQGVSRFFA